MKFYTLVIHSHSRISEKFHYITYLIDIITMLLVMATYSVKPFLKIGTALLIGPAENCPIFWCD